MRPLEQFYTDDPRWYEQIGDIHALLERAKISEEQSGDLLHLRKLSRILSIHASTAIEGNRLTLGQVQHADQLVRLAQGEPAAAYEHLGQYDRLLPGDAGVTFLQGISLEGMDRRQEAAAQYQAYLKRVQKGKAAEHAYSRLQAWGYLK